MADKTVVVRLRAEIGRYEADLGRAASSTRALGRELTGAGKTGGADLDRIARGATGVGVALTAGFAMAANATMGFDKQLSELGAVSSATAEEMDRLRDAALEAGAKTAFSASEAALAQTELAKAGVSTADILGGGLAGALDLAAAGGLDLGCAAEIAASSMTTFGLAGKDVSKIADVLAAGANKSAADVDDMAMALSQSGLVADQFGLKLEDSVGVLAMFAQNGLRGSDAGTSFKTMLQRLVPQSKEAADKMAELGIDMFDAQGKFIGIEGAAGELQAGLTNLTEEQRNSALATIFGSDAVRAATVLYQGGAEGVAEWVSKVDDAGFASEVAGKRMDNLAGDLEELRGSIETTLIKGGSHATGALRLLTQTATSTVNGFAELPGPLQAVGMGLAGIGGAGALALGGIAYIAPRAREAKAALEGMGSAGPLVARNLTNIASAVTVVGAGLGVFTAWQQMLASARGEAEAWSATWEDSAFSERNTASLENFGDTLGRVRQEQQRMMAEGFGTNALWDADKKAQLEAGVEALDELEAKMSQVDLASRMLAGQLGISAEAAFQFTMAQRDAGFEMSGGGFLTAALNSASALADNYEAMTTGTEGAHKMAGAMDTLGSEVSSVEDQVKAFSESLDVLYNQMFGIEEASDAFQRGVNELPAVLKAAAEEGLSLNDVLAGQSTAAIEVRDHMRGMISDASDLIAEWQEQGITGEELAGKIYLLSDSFRQQAIDAGLPAPVVDHYLALLGKIPITKNTAIDADVEPAMLQLDRLARRLNDLPGGLHFSVGGGGGFQLASGGSVPAPPRYLARGGASGSDTVAAYLTPGEYVMRAGAVDHWGAGTFAAMNAGMTPPGLGQGVTGGGGGTPVVNHNVTINAGLGTDPYQLGRAVRDALEELYRRNGSGVRAFL